MYSNTIIFSWLFTKNNYFTVKIIIKIFTGTIYLLKEIKINTFKMDKIHFPKLKYFDTEVSV